MTEIVPAPRDGITRRNFVTQGTQVGAAAVAGGVLLSACGSSSSSSSSASGNTTTIAGPHGLAALPGGTPKKGGAFTAGVLSGGSAESLWPGFSAIYADWLRQYSLYNLLFNVGPEITPILPGLALSAESNADATVWTFHLRKGVTWHDGKPFTADDVVYNVKNQWSNKVHYFYGNVAGLLNFNAARALDPHTVEMTLYKGVAEFPAFLTWQNALIVQNGATQKSCNTHPIGTGAFKFQSFTPGQQSIFVANPDYWEPGLPHVDKLVVKSTFTDNSSALNALLGGEVNLLPEILPTQAREQLSSKQVQILQAPPLGQTYAFCMRVDQGQFADNRVRQAFMLLANRQELINGALSGFGTPQNDLIGAGANYFASDLKRTMDVEKAKSLFKAAGASGSTYTLPIANASPGMVESATILAQQAEAAGVHVNVKQGSAATYYTYAGGYTKRPFGFEIFQPNASLTTIFRGTLVRGAPFNDTHWGDGPISRTNAINAAIGQTDKSKAQQQWHALQVDQFNQGGYLAWANLPFIDAAANNVRGLKSGAAFNYNGWRLQDGWVE